MMRSKLFVLGLTLAVPTVAHAAGLQPALADSSPTASLSVEEYCRKYTCIYKNLDPSPISPLKGPYVCYCGYNNAAIRVWIISNENQIFKSDLGKYMVPLKTGSIIAGKPVTNLLTDQYVDANRFARKNFTFYIIRLANGNKTMSSSFGVSGSR